jgi:hypothetical protein
MLSFDEVARTGISAPSMPALTIVFPELMLMMSSNVMASTQVASSHSIPATYPPSLHLVLINFRVPVLAHTAFLRAKTLSFFSLITLSKLLRLFNSSL